MTPLKDCKSCNPHIWPKSPPIQALFLLLSQLSLHTCLHNVWTFILEYFNCAWYECLELTQNCQICMCKLIYQLKKKDPTYRGQSTFNSSSYRHLGKELKITNTFVLLRQTHKTTTNEYKVLVSFSHKTACVLSAVLSERLNLCLQGWSRLQQMITYQKQSGLYWVSLCAAWGGASTQSSALTFWGWRGVGALHSLQLSC